MITEADLYGASWRKSSRSGGDNNCVEVAALRDAIAIRDSKHPSGPKLIFGRDAWRTFRAAALNGELDLP